MIAVFSRRPVNVIASIQVAYDPDEVLQGPMGPLVKNMIDQFLPGLEYEESVPPITNLPGLGEVSLSCLNSSCPGNMHLALEILRSFKEPQGGNPFRCCLWVQPFRS